MDQLTRPERNLYDAHIQGWKVKKRREGKTDEEIEREVGDVKRRYIIFLLGLRARNQAILLRHYEGRMPPLDYTSDAKICPRCKLLRRKD